MEDLTSDVIPQPKVERIHKRRSDKDNGRCKTPFYQRQFTHVSG